MSVRLRHPNGQTRDVRDDVFERTRDFWIRRGYSVVSDEPGKEVVSSTETTSPEPDAMTFSDEVATTQPSRREPSRHFEREENAVAELAGISGIGDEIARVLVRKGIHTRDDLRRQPDDVLLGVPGIGSAILKRIREQLEE